MKTQPWLRRFRAGALPVLLGLAFAFPAQSAITKETRDGLVKSLESLGEATTPEQVQELAGRFVDPAVTDAEWSGFFDEYFRSHRFTVLPGFWRQGIGSAPVESQVRVAQVSGLAAAAAVGDGVGGLRSEISEDGYNSTAAALLWLSEIVNNIPGESAGPVFEALRTSVKVKLEGLVPAADSPPVPGAQLVWLGAQLALVARDYAVRAGKGPEPVAALLGLQGAGLHFWMAYGILLIDNSGLDGAQQRSLDSLLMAVPRELHSVGAVVVPETTGLNPVSWNLRLNSGHILPVAAIPLDRPTRPDEFAPTTPQPIAPLFTAEAARQLVRAIQAVQFPARPELVLRRNIILGSAGANSLAYLRQTVSPGVYRSDPDELLPSLAYLWFVSTPAMFDTAHYLFSLNQREAFDQFLLMADLLSGGGDRTVMFFTGPNGVVVPTFAPVAHTVLTAPAWVDAPGNLAVPYPSGARYLTGIILPSGRWSFNIGPGGVVSRYWNTVME